MNVHKLNTFESLTSVSERGWSRFTFFPSELTTYSFQGNKFMVMTCVRVKKESLNP